MQVIITVTRSVRLSSLVEMTEEEFQRFEERLDGDNREDCRKAEKEINELVDPSDWIDDSLDDLDEFRRYNPKPETEVEVEA